jgi:hypothetical protein
MTRKAPLLMAMFVLFSLIAAAAWPAWPETGDTGLTVHEWGTFTSVAGQRGEPVTWYSYGGSSDLPCFVEHFGGFKGGLSGTVRMETPVIYFYGPQGLSANVSVRFPKGTVTEWYPKAILDKSFNSIEWHDVAMAPGTSPDFPRTGQPSHYYAARETDAQPLQVGSQQEKFLFYRGVGTFPLPLAATLTTDGNINIRSVGDDRVAGLIVFENRHGAVRYRLIGSVEGEVKVDTKLLQDNWAGLLMDLEHVLIDHGLYQKEARAMVETWKDSWFEEGTRLFYIVPQQAVDSILPLDIQPTPRQVARVFVGRMELITPAMQEEVLQAVARNDRAALEKYGRFLQPIAQRAGITRNALLDSIAADKSRQSTTCAR